MEQRPPCNFEAIAPGSQDENPCTPQVDDDFRGIRINAPREVFFGPGTEREAEYHVYATLGPYQSNVVQIKVSRKK